MRSRCGRIGLGIKFIEPGVFDVHECVCVRWVCVGVLAKNDIIHIVYSTRPLDKPFQLSARRCPHPKFLDPNVPIGRKLITNGGLYQSYVLL